MPIHFRCTHLQFPGNCNQIICSWGNWTRKSFNAETNCFVEMRVKNESDGFKKIRQADDCKGIPTRCRDDEKEEREDCKWKRDVVDYGSTIIMMIIIMIMMTTRIWSWYWSRRNTFSWLKWVTVAEYRAELPHVRMIDTDDGSTKHFKHWNLLEFSVLHSEIQLSKVRFFLLSYGYVASISPSASQISLLKGFGFMIHWMIIFEIFLNPRSQWRTWRKTDHYCSTYSSSNHSSTNNCRYR